MEKTAHLKRAKSLGKHSEFEALVQVKQTVHHSETTARSKFPKKKKGKSVVDPSGGGETAGILVFRLGHLHVLVCIDATPLQHTLKYEVSRMGTPLGVNSRVLEWVRDMIVEP